MSIRYLDSTDRAVENTGYDGGVESVVTDALVGVEVESLSKLITFNVGSASESPTNDAGVESVLTNAVVAWGIEGLSLRVTDSVAHA